MNRSQKTRWAKLAALTVAVALSACGGSDEAPVADPVPGPSPAPSPAPTPSPSPAPAPTPTPAPAPAPSPAADSSACWNDAMSNPGSTWKVSFRERGIGGDVDGIVVTTETLGPKTFNNQAATESRISTRVQGKPDEVQLSYSLLNAQEYRQLGWRLANGSEVYLEPGWVTPRAMQVGQSATSTFTTRFADGSAPSTSTTTTTTYLGRQTITTPAGTFETCQVRFVDQGGGTSYTWTVANGPYSGIDVRHSLAIAADGSSAWVREATAIEASFR